MSRVKPINVKVPVAKVVKALESAIASREKQLTDNEKAQKEYLKARADWEKAVVEAIRAGKGKVKSVSRTGGWRNDSPEVSVTFDEVVKFPKEPESVAKWQIDQELEELRNAIAILKMTDEEMVSTSTYSGVARYIS